MKLDYRQRREKPPEAIFPSSDDETVYTCLSTHDERKTFLQTQRGAEIICETRFASSQLGKGGEQNLISARQTASQLFRVSVWARRRW